MPQDLELAQYTTYVELVQRFVDIGWPAIKSALLLEEPADILHADDVAPETFQCDLYKHPTEELNMQNQSQSMSLLESQAGPPNPKAGSHKRGFSFAWSAGQGCKNFCDVVGIGPSLQDDSRSVGCA